MSLTYKFPSSGEEERKEEKELSTDSVDGIEEYSTPGNARTICFVDTGGNQKVFYYALNTCLEYKPEQSTINLTFTSHIVTLKGSNLADLFGRLRQQLVRTVVVSDPRYSELDNSKETIISDIQFSNV